MLVSYGQTSYIFAEFENEMLSEDWGYKFKTDFSQCLHWVAVAVTQQ